MDAGEASQDQRGKDVAVDLLGDQREDADEDRQWMTGPRLRQREDAREGTPDQRAEERDGLEEEGDDAHQQGPTQAKQPEAKGRHHPDEYARQELAAHVLNQDAIQSFHQLSRVILTG